MIDGLKVMIPGEELRRLLEAQIHILFERK